MAPARDSNRLLGLSEMCFEEFRVLAFWIPVAGRAFRFSIREKLKGNNYHWGQNYYIPFFMFWGIIFGNYYRKLYSN